MLTSGSGISEDPLWSSSSTGTMSSQSISERERMKEEAKRKRAKEAAAAFPQIQGGATNCSLSKVVFQPRKAGPDANDPLAKDIQSALGPFTNLLPAIRGQQLHLYLGIDTSIPGTPEVSEVNFENSLHRHSNAGSSAFQVPHINEESKEVKKETQPKNHVHAKARPRENGKQTHGNGLQPARSSAGLRDSQDRPKPPKLDMPSGENAAMVKSNSIKIETILREMTHAMSVPPLTDIQTPVKGSGNKFAFPLPPSKDNPPLHKQRTKSQDSTGSRKNDELLKDDLHLSEDETDEDQASNCSITDGKSSGLPRTDRNRGLSTSSTSSSDGSSSDSDSDSDSSDSDSSHAHDPISPKKEIPIRKAQTSTLNSTHKRTKDLDPNTKSQSPLNRKLESTSRKKKVNNSNINSKDDALRTSNGFTIEPIQKDVDRVIPKTENDLTVKPAYTLDAMENVMDCPINFSSEHVNINDASERSRVNHGPIGTMKTEPLDTMDVFGSAPSMDMATRTDGDASSDAFLGEQVFPEHPSIDFDAMLDGSLFCSSRDFEKLEEKLSKPNDYPSYGGVLGVDEGQSLERKAPPVLENPQQILSERSRALDDPSRVLVDPPQLIEEARRDLEPQLSQNLLSSSNCVTAFSADGDIACVSNSTSMDIDILDTQTASIFSMGDVLPAASLSSTTNCLPYTEPGNLISDIPGTETIENNMNIQNSQDGARLLRCDLDCDNSLNLDYVEKERINFDKSNFRNDGARLGFHSLPNGTSLKIKLPLSKIRLKSQLKFQTSKGKSIEQIMESRRVYDRREDETTKHEGRRTVAEKSIRGGKRPADLGTLNQDGTLKHEDTVIDRRAKVPRSASEDDEEIDVVGINDNSPLKKTISSKRANKRWGSSVGHLKTVDGGGDIRTNITKTEPTSFAPPKDNVTLPTAVNRRTSLSGEVVNKKGEVTTIPLSIPYVQVPLKPIKSESRKLFPDTPPNSLPRLNGFCSPPFKETHELKVHIDLKKLLRVPGRTAKKSVCEQACSSFPIEVPKRPQKSESESSDMVISPTYSSADNQDLEEVNPPIAPSPIPDQKPPKIIMPEKEEIPQEKIEAKNKRGRPRKKKEPEVNTKMSPVNPDVCSCGALRKDAARDTIRLGTYRTCYPTYLKEGQRNKHIADCLTNPADKAQKYIESVLSYVQFLIGLEVSGKTKTRQEMDEFMKTNSECIGLVDHVINHYTRKTSGSGHVRDERFLFLCLRLQSLLYFKLFQVKKDSAAKHAKVLSEYFKMYRQPSNRSRSPTSCRPTIKGSTGTPSPMSPGPSPGGSVASVGSAGSSGSSGSSDKVPNGATITIPIDMYEKASQYLTYTKYMLHGTRLWDDADGLVSTCQEFTSNLNRRVGYLTQKSSMLHVVDYIRAGLQMTRENSNV